jgi:hypothetical protein
VYTNREYIAISTVYPALYVVCVSQVGHTAMSAGDGVGGVKAVVHAIEREGEGEGNGWGRTATVTVTLFCPGLTEQREKSGRGRWQLDGVCRCLTGIGEGRSSSLE